MCREAGKSIYSIDDAGSSAIAIGSFFQIPQLIQSTIPVVLFPSDLELAVLRHCGFTPLPLFCATAFNHAPFSVFIVSDIMELGMVIIGTRFNRHQTIPHMPIMLAISGSDSGGGAGQQADIKTASALGVYACSCISAVTVQNTQGVKSVVLMDEDTVRGQMEAVCEDMHVDAVKIGMTGSRVIIKTITEMILRYKLRNVVLDPVMASSR